MHIAVLIKQIPRSETLRLGPDGRLIRQGVELEMNAYCRRAVRKGIDLAHFFDGRCTVFTLGPATAENVLREAVAAGADEGILISDPAFAGSDTLATAHALAAALRLEGPFDLVLVGRNSVDADTGQVGPAVAELLDLPFVCSARALELQENSLQARCEREEGWSKVTVALPAVVSAAERLCQPVKVPPQERQQVPANKFRHLRAVDLGPGAWGQEGSPTRVGEIRSLEITRSQHRLNGSIVRQVKEALSLLVGRGALARSMPTEELIVSPQRMLGGPSVAVLVEPGRVRLSHELAGTAADLAHQMSGHVVALTPRESEANPVALGARGADELVVFDGCRGVRGFARGCIDWAIENDPWAVLAPSTVWGREIAARMAAHLKAGLTGDAIGLEVKDGRLVTWKPAFGGRAVVAIATESSIQMATLRPGVATPYKPRSGVTIAVRKRVVAECRDEVCVLERVCDDDPDKLFSASTVIGVGTGVAQQEYYLLDELRTRLNAELAATRKVTDLGWLPRSRQVGLTGHSIAPRLYVAIGLSGKLNHTVGVRGASTVLAINSDPEAPIFKDADVGILGDWREVVPVIVEQLGMLSDSFMTAQNL